MARSNTAAAYTEATKSSKRMPHPAGRDSICFAGKGLMMSNILVITNAQAIVSNRLGARKSKTVRKKLATSSSTKGLGSFLFQCRSAHGPKAIERPQHKIKNNAVINVSTKGENAKAMKAKMITAGRVPTVPGATGERPNQNAVQTNIFTLSRLFFMVFFSVSAGPRLCSLVNVLP